MTPRRPCVTLLFIVLHYVPSRLIMFMAPGIIRANLTLILIIFSMPCQSSSACLAIVIVISLHHACFLRGTVNQRLSEATDLVVVDYGTGFVAIGESLRTTCPMSSCSWLLDDSCKLDTHAMTGNMPLNALALSSSSRFSLLA